MGHLPCLLTLQESFAISFSFTTRDSMCLLRAREEGERGEGARGEGERVHGEGEGARGGEERVHGGGGEGIF